MSSLAGDPAGRARLSLTDRAGSTKHCWLDDKGIVLGSALGCDLRLGQWAPPVWVLLATCPGGVMIRVLAPLSKIEVNGQPWQAGFCPLPVRVTLGELTLQVRYSDPLMDQPFGSGPTETEGEHGADRWYRKARQLLKMMRGLLTGATAESVGREGADHTSPSMSPALETAWQMLRTAQEQHRDDLVRLDREKALVAARWADIERERIEREAEGLRFRQQSAELEARERDIAANEAAFDEIAHSLQQRELELDDLLNKASEERNLLSRSLAECSAQEARLLSRELEIESRALTAPEREQAHDSEAPVPVSEPPAASISIEHEAVPAHQVAGEPRPVSPQVPVIPGEWFSKQPFFVVETVPMAVPGDSVLRADPPEPGDASNFDRDDPSIPPAGFPLPGKGDPLPDWLMAWFAASVSKAAAARSGQVAGSGIWDATGNIADPDARLAKTLVEHRLANQADIDILLAVARQERRALRALLLGDGVLTFYQLSQMEGGNIHGLYSGPLVVLERLPSGSREAVFAVHDPRRNAEGLLHHLAESEMADAARPDEYAQRAKAVSSLESENLQATWEVLEIAGRPAVLREGVVGSASDGWSTLAAVPGVWYRLLLQSALGLRDLHSAGLCHGRVDTGHVVATPNGLVKLMNPSVPSWLGGGEGDESPAADLKCLGKLARHWLSDENRGGPKPKPLPAPLVSILERLEGHAGPAIPSAVELADELDRAGSQVPGNTAAFQRFLAEIRSETGMGGVSASA